MTRTLRADMHVHTCHSNRSGTLRFLHSRDCYSRPADVYERAKRRGMDLVAFTDHDSIGGAIELLDSRPDLRDVIVGEEISCELPGSGIEVHIAAYGMTQALHRDVQRLRRNVFDVADRLRESGVFFALNHLLHFFRGQIPLDDYLEVLDAVPALEVRNGTMLAGHNLLIERLAAGRFAGIAGSDAHTLRRVGTTWTEAPGRTRDEFLENVRCGRGVPGGAHGTAATVAGDAHGVVASYMASLVTGRPHDVRSWRRAGCLAFAAVSLPFQFMPIVVAARSKAGERRAVRALTEYLAGTKDAEAEIVGVA